jgi:hypothetical protein
VLGKKFAGRLWRANPANKELKECLVKKEISDLEKKLEKIIGE